MKETILAIKEKWNIKHTILAVGAIIVFAFFIVNNIKDKQSNGSSQIVEVEVALVEVKDIPIEVKEIGTVIPSQSVAITSRIDSQVVEVLFKDGDKVNQDQILFRLDDKAIKAQLRQLEANVARDKAQLNYLKKEYDRTLKIFQSGYESKEKTEEALSAYEAQAATLKATEESVNNIKTQLDYAVIISPISGKTGTINTNVGNNVKANDTQPLVTINQIDPIEVQFSLPQKYFDDVQVALGKSQVPVMVENPEKKEVIKGYLEYIENTMDQNDNFAARGIFPNPSEKLWPGMYVNVIVTLGYHKGVKIIPITAVQGGQSNKKYVYVVEGDKASKRGIKVISTAEKHVVASDGVSLGEAVITHGLSGIKDGTLVRVINANDKSGKIS